MGRCRDATWSYQVVATSARRCALHKTSTMQSWSRPAGVGGLGRRGRAWRRTRRPLAWQAGQPKTPAHRGGKGKIASVSVGLIGLTSSHTDAARQKVWAARWRLRARCAVARTVRTVVSVWQCRRRLGGARRLGRQVGGQGHAAQVARPCAP